MPDDSTLDEWGAANYTLDGNNGPKTVAMMFEAARDYVFPDLSAAPVSDSGRTSLRALTPWLELALARTGRRLVAEALDAVYRQTVLAPFGWSTWAPNGTPVFSTGDADGLRTLVIENGSASDRGCWVSPRVGVEGQREVLVSFRYRTQGVEGEKAALVRVMPRAGGANLGDHAVLIPAPPSTAWATVEHRLDLPPGSDALGADPFLWHAAGQVAFTALSIRGGDGRLLLAPDEFQHVVRRRPGNILPWNLLPEQPQTTPKADEQFGTTGLRRGWCSLFPASGFAVLRQAWEGTEATAALLSYGPYGGGHGHPDMLKLVARAGGRTVLAANPHFGYDDRRHGTWTNTTIAHNTVVVDQTSQFPGGTGSGWGNVRPDRIVQGVLLGFHADEHVKAVRARCENAHEGVSLDRTVVLLGDVLLDLFQVDCADGGEHVFDYVLHLSDAPRVIGVDLTPRGPLGKEQGYEHLDDLHSGRSDGALAIAVGGVTLHIAGAPGTEVITATAPHIDGRRSPLLIVRRTGRRTGFGLAMAPSGTADLALAPGVLRAAVGGSAWVIDAAAARGLRVASERGVWQIGSVGESTRRTGAAGEAQWPPLRDGGVFIPAPRPQ